MEICLKCALLRSRISSFPRSNLALKSCRRYLAQSKVKEKTNIWEPVIGLEIHAQINSKSKLFSNARNQFMAPPNSLVSDFDAALPGTLPVLNKRCVEAAVSTALSLNCTINHKSYFDRKHYFYADLPQGYQITQYRKPIAVDGYMLIPVAVSSDQNNGINWKKIHIEQLQLEQDSGKSLHDEKDKISLIDLNRAGVGLMEIVTGPDFSSAEEAATFVLDLQLTLQKLGTCKGKIAEGQMRVDANISVRRPGEKLGVRSEVKNIAGIQFLKQAIEYEISRHKNLLQKGERVVNETRDFVTEKGITVAMRDKEEFQDYRFMPEPNLPPLILYTDKTLSNKLDTEQQVNVDELQRQMPDQLPKDLRKQLVDTYCLSIYESSFLMEYKLAEYFLSVMAAEPNLTPITVWTWIKIHILGVMYAKNLKASECPVTPQQVAELLSLVKSQDINEDTGAKTFQIMIDQGGSATEIVDANDWRMIKEKSVIESLCRTAIDSKDPSKLFHKYRVGEHKRPKNKKAVAAIVNAVMELSNKKAHTAVTQAVAKDMLDKVFIEHSNKNK